MRRSLVGILATAVSFALLARIIDWRAAKTALQTADLGLITLAVGCLLLSLGAKTARWRLLLPVEAPLTRPRLFRILHISFLLNNVLPARLGDVARVAMTSRQPGVRLGHVLSSLLTERVTDAVTLLACFVLISPFLPIPSAYTSWLHVAWVVLASGIVLLSLGILLRHWLARLARWTHVGGHLPFGAILREEAASFRDGWRQLFSRRHAASIWAWSGASWVGAFAINYLLMQSLHIHAPIAVAVLLTCTTNLAMLLPSSPGYLGVFHAAATLSLLPFNVGASQAFSFAILAHLVNVLPVSILGAAFLLAGRESVAFSLRPQRIDPPGP